MKIHTKNKFKIINILSVLILMSLPLLGGDCEETVQNSGVVPAEMVGNWRLLEQTGALQDICPEEVVNFQSSGVAVLTCPNATSVDRNFSVENLVVTYTQTSVSYQAEFSNNNNNLILYGINVSRNLFYQKVITDVTPKSSDKKTDFINSSETGGVK